MCLHNNRLCFKSFTYDYLHELSPDLTNRIINQRKNGIITKIFVADNPDSVTFNTYLGAGYTLYYTYGKFFVFVCRMCSNINAVTEI